MTFRSLSIPTRRRGSALLEVILALALFVAAAAIVTSGMNASTDNLERQRANTHAANLAATVLAETRLGIRSTAASGEQVFEPPFEKWTWQLGVSAVETEAGEGSGLTRVEVVIRHKESSLVRRLAEIMPAGGCPAKRGLGRPLTHAFPAAKPPGFRPS